MVNKIKSVITCECAGLESIDRKLKIPTDKTVIVQLYDPQVLFLIFVDPLRLVWEVTGSITGFEQMLDPTEHRFDQSYILIWKSAY